MPYAYYDFNVYFSKFFAPHAFLGKFDSVIWISSNWLKFGTGVHCYMLITVLMFIFHTSFHSYFLFKFGLRLCSSLNWLKFATEVDCYMFISILVFIFSKFLSFIFFWENLVQKSDVLLIDSTLAQGHIATYLLVLCICICICIWSHFQTPCTVHHKLLYKILREFNVFD